MKTKITTVVLVLLFIGYMAIGGTSEPIRSMGAALSGIQDAIMSLGDKPAVEKEWYYGHFEVMPSQNDAIFIVPIGKQFVLKRLYVYPYGDKGSTLWHLAADETLVLNGTIIRYSYTTNQGGFTYKYEHDFPDDCITINSGETLNTVNEADRSLDVTVIGYFRDMP